MCDGAVRAYNYIVSNRNTRQNNGFRTDKYPISYRNTSDFCITQKSLCAGIMTENMHTRSYCDIITDLDQPTMSRVKNRTM